MQQTQQITIPKIIIANKSCAFCGAPLNDKFIYLGLDYNPDKQYCSRTCAENN